MRPTLSPCDENCPLQARKRNKNIYSKEQVCCCLSSYTSHYCIKTKRNRDVALIFSTGEQYWSLQTGNRRLFPVGVDKNLIDSQPAQPAPSKTKDTHILSTHWITKCYAPVKVGCDRSILHHIESCLDTFLVSSWPMGWLGCVWCHP